MAKHIFLLFLFISCLCRGQTTYVSPLTQHWPSIFTTEYREIDRSITVEANSIIIATKTSEGKDIQTLLIREIGSVDGNTVFTCTSARNEEITLIIPPRERIEFMDIYKRSPRTGEEIQLRFLLSRIIQHSALSY